MQLYLNLLFQIEAINKKYLLLEEEIRDKCRICHSEISNFVDSVLDVKLAELKKSAEWFSNEMQERHKVLATFPILQFHILAYCVCPNFFVQWKHPSLCSTLANYASCLKTRDSTTIPIFSVKLSSQCSFRCVTWWDKSAAVFQFFELFWYTLCKKYSSALIFASWGS